MPTIIDSLIVKLGLDSKDVDTKTPGAVKNLASIEKQGKSTEQSIEGLTRTVGSFLALIGGTVGIKSFIADFITANAQLDRFSQNIGASVSTISAWGKASERFGGSAQGLQGSLDMLSKSQTELMLTGQSALIPYFSALGVSLAGVDGKARPVTDVLLSLSDAAARVTATSGRPAANNILRAMGLDQGTANLLLMNRKELELLIQREKEQAAITQKQADIAAKWQFQISGITQKFQELGLRILEKAAPAIDTILGLFERFSDWAQANQEFIEDFLKIMAVGLAAVGLAAAPINLTIIAVLALAAGIALLYQDYQTWKRGGDSLIDWGKWGAGISEATKAIGALASALENLYDKADKWYKAKFGKTIWGEFKDDTKELGKELGIRSSGQTSSGISGGRLSPDAIKKYFQGQGWTEAQAAGIAANINAESGGYAAAKGDKGSAYGLAQWHSDRQAAFAKWAGHTIQDSTPAEQLGFIQYELTQGSRKAAGDALKGANNATDAGGIVSRQYEAPLDAAGEASRRGAYAQSLLGVPGASQFASAAPGDGSSGGNSTVDKSVETHIGEVNVYTNATDAPGIVKDMRKSMDFLFPGQFVAGMS